jgi:hypothetical protein
MSNWKLGYHLMLPLISVFWRWDERNRATGVSFAERIRTTRPRFESHPFQGVRLIASFGG